MAESLAETYEYAQGLRSKKLLKVFGNRPTKKDDPYMVSNEVFSRLIEEFESCIIQSPKPGDAQLYYNCKNSETFMIVMHWVTRDEFPSDFTSSDGTGKGKLALSQAWIFGVRNHALKFQDQVILALLRLLESHDLSLYHIRRITIEIQANHDIQDLAQTSKLHFLMLELLAEGFMDGRIAHAALIHFADYVKFWQDSTYAQESVRQRKRMEAGTDHWKEFMVGGEAKEWYSA